MKMLIISMHLVLLSSTLSSSFHPCLSLSYVFPSLVLFFTTYLLVISLPLLLPLLLSDESPSSGFPTSHSTHPPG